MNKDTKYKDLDKGRGGAIVLFEREEEVRAVIKTGGSHGAELHFEEFDRDAMEAPAWRPISGALTPIQILAQGLTFKLLRQLRETEARIGSPFDWEREPCIRDDQPSDIVDAVNVPEDPLAACRSNEPHFTPTPPEDMADDDDDRPSFTPPDDSHSPTDALAPDDEDDS